MRTLDGQGRDVDNAYRGTSLIRTSAPLGPTYHLAIGARGMRYFFRTCQMWEARIQNPCFLWARYPFSL